MAINNVLLIVKYLQKTGRHFTINIDNHLGVFRLCGATGTVFGPGFGLLGFFRGVGDGLLRLCPGTVTVFLAIVIYFSC